MSFSPTNNRCCTAIKEYFNRPATQEEHGRYMRIVFIASLVFMVITLVLLIKLVKPIECPSCHTWIRP